MQRGQVIATSKVVSFGLMLAAMVSCEKIKCEEETPSLTYDTLMVSEDKSELIFQTKFEDCQGDIGHVGEVTPETNYTVRTFMYQRVEGAWERWFPQNLDDTLAFFSVIPGSTKNREGWLLKGTIIQAFPLVSLYQDDRDTIRFESYIFDNAGHRSNRVVSDPYIFR
jgi:hypothetical protein